LNLDKITRHCVTSTEFASIFFYKSADARPSCLWSHQGILFDKLLTPCLRHDSLTSFMNLPPALRQSLLGAAPPNPCLRT